SLPTSTMAPLGGAPPGGSMKRDPPYVGLRRWLRSLGLHAFRRTAGAGHQLVHRLGRGGHAKAGGDHHHRAKPAGTVQLHAFADEALALAHATVGLGIAQLFG